VRNPFLSDYVPIVIWEPVDNGDYQPSTDRVSKRDNADGNQAPEYI
jgi:hypothetical protein